MHTSYNGRETPELTCHVSEAESGGYRLIVKRAGEVVHEVLDDDLVAIERARDQYLDPNDILSARVAVWDLLMDNEEMEDMLDAIYAERGRDWRPS